MKQCNKCGKPITFRHCKSFNVCCENKAVYVIPGSGDKQFVSVQGHLIIGREASDGIRCYPVHSC